MRIGVQLLPQALDVRIHRPVAADVLIAPDQREQIVAGEYSPGRRCQRIEQLGLLAREAELMPIEGDAQRRQMDGQIADDQRLAWAAFVHAADDGTDARHDLARGEGLDDVIVRADIQAENPVCILVLGGDHQDRNRQYCADAAVDAGKHDVQQNQRGRGGVEQGKRFFSGARSQIGPAFGLYIFGEYFQDLLVVVNDQDGIQANSSVSV